MRYYIDSEFVDDGKAIDLISIGIVAEDGRTYYAQSAEFLKDGKPTLWIWENVIPHLDNHWLERARIKEEIVTFLDPEKYGKPELIGWCSGYDFVVFCQLFGTMMDLPAGYPHYIKDLQFILDKFDISDDQLPADENEGLAHNALVDARYIGQLWDYTQHHEKFAMAVDLTRTAIDDPGVREQLKLLLKIGEVRPSSEKTITASRESAVYVSRGVHSLRESVSAIRSLSAVYAH